MVVALIEDLIDTARNRGSLAVRHAVGFSAGVRYRQSCALTLAWVVMRVVVVLRRLHRRAVRVGRGLLRGGVRG